jgi:hypothetical protein
VTVSVKKASSKTLTELSPPRRFLLSDRWSSPMRIARFQPPFSASDAGSDNFLRKP